MSAACAAVGLVHGLGFARVLADTGSPEGEIPAALLGFNVDIELAQLALLLFGVAVIVRRSNLGELGPPRQWLGHALGAVAVMWCIERVLAL